MNKVTLLPLPGYVLLSPLEDQEEAYGSGLVVPESAKEKPAKGKVLAIGGKLIKDGKEEVCPVEKGQVIIYKRWGGQDIREEGKKMKLVNWSEIMAVYK